MKYAVALLFFLALLCASCRTSPHPNAVVIRQVLPHCELGRRLDATMDISIENATLEEAIREVDLHRHVIIDPAVRDRAVSLDLQNTTPGEALRKLTRRGLALTLGPDGDVLFITGPERRNSSERSARVLSMIEDQSLSLTIPRMAAVKKKAGDIVRWLVAQRRSSLAQRLRSKVVPILLEGADTAMSFEFKNVSMRTCLWAVAMMSGSEVVLERGSVVSLRSWTPTEK